MVNDANVEQIQRAVLGQFSHNVGQFLHGFVLTNHLNIIWLIMSTLPLPGIIHHRLLVSLKLAHKSPVIQGGVSKNHLILFEEV